MARSSGPWTSPSFSIKLRIARSIRPKPRFMMGLSVDANLGSLASIQQSVQNGQFLSGLGGLVLSRFD